MNLGQLQDRVYRLVWSKQKASRKTESVSNTVVAYFGAATPVTAITKSRINDFRITCAASGQSPATINRKLSALGKMLAVAHEEDLIPSCPKIKRERESAGRDRFLTYDEEDQLLTLLRVWGQHAAADLVMFLLDTGCRLGEALDLRWDSVRERQVTFLDTKNGTNRTVPLTARLRNMLKGVEDSAKYGVVNPATPLFWGFADGGRKLRKVWDRARRHLKLDGDPLFVIHILRHTCASRLLQGGADLEYVRQWLGHKSSKMTQRYAHLAPTSLDKLTAILERRENG